MINNLTIYQHVRNLRFVYNTRAFGLYQYPIYANPILRKIRKNAYKVKKLIFKMRIYEKCKLYINILTFNSCTYITLSFIMYLKCLNLIKY